MDRIRVQLRASIVYCAELIFMLVESSRIGELDSAEGNHCELSDEERAMSSTKRS